MKKNRVIQFFLLCLVVITPTLVGAEALQNPLGSADTPNEVIANIIKTFLGIVGAITLLIFVYGGFLFLTSAGQPEKVQKGRDTLMWATIGLIIIFGSYGIARAIFEAFGAK